ncbi:MAG: ATP:cob(I)alamin adenosyltransferase, partial [bacterium]|nr:ATP:cob(I)alamin adenosyltransferase [bacterium]
TMDRWMAAGPPAGFVLPGGTPLAAHLHFARTVARRAERRLWSLHREAPIESSILRFVNRLSDLLFSMALRF